MSLYEVFHCLAVELFALLYQPRPVANTASSRVATSWVSKVPIGSGLARLVSEKCLEIREHHAKKTHSPNKETTREKTRNVFSLNKQLRRRLKRPPCLNN